VPPNWFWFSTPRGWPVALKKKLLAFSAVFRRNSNAEPWNSLVPERVTSEMFAPPLRPD
jgi:hypothetical protein